METVLEVDHLAKNYGRTPALTGATFAVSAGEIFGLLGPNGAGKTTLVSILAGLSAPTSGHARIFGLPPHTARDRVGLATQDLALYGELTARENLRFFGRLYGLHGAGLRERVDEVLEAIALADRADRRAGTFSGGMKRRLNLGIAIVHRPTLLLLDEPTTGVDPQSRNHIFEHVRRLNQDGVTVIYSSHYMEEVESLCDRVAILDRGRVIALDAITDMIASMGGHIRLGLTHPTEALIEDLGRLDGVRDVRRCDVGLEVIAAEPSRALASVMGAVYAAGQVPGSVRVSEPTLEQVFLDLTGSALRDD